MDYLNTDHLPNRLMFALFMAVLSMVLVKVTGDVYFRYFDKTVYYSIEQPISVDKKFYNPCDVTKATIKRVSMIDTTGSSVVDLILMNADNQQEKIANLNRTMAIPKGTRTIVVDWPLPCNIPEGRYFWQAVVKYSVRGIEKSYGYLTETFNVVNKPVDKVPE